MQPLRRVVLATGNAGKVRELNALLAEIGMQAVPQTDLGVPPADETGATFAENALIKARHAADRTGLPAIADDSGIEVDALDGAPGVHSARYAGEHGNDEANWRRLLQVLADVPEAHRTGRFRCAVAYVRSAGDPDPVVCEGIWPGRVTTGPRGSNGFGYDPVFLIPELGRTVAELAPAEKNRRSHRGQALRKLVAALAGRNRASPGPVTAGRMFQRTCPRP